MPTVVREGVPLELVVLRAEHSAQTKMHLVPQHWAGPGLLGCHLLPYSP